jgi:hypothetical protein
MENNPILQRPTSKPRRVNNRIKTTLRSHKEDASAINPSREEFDLLKKEVESLKRLVLQNQFEIKKLNAIILELYQTISN